MDSYKTDDTGETPEILNDYFVKIEESIARKAKTLNDNADCKTFLSSSVSQSIVFELPQPRKNFNIIYSLNIKKAVVYHNISSFFLCMEGKF